MQVNFDAALAAAMRAFGVPVVYSPRGGTAFDTVGAFNAAYADVDFSSGVPVASSKPMLGIRASQVPAGVVCGQGDRVNVASADWLVVNVEPDGRGHLRCILKALT